MLDIAWKSVASSLHEALLSFQKHSYHEDGVFLQGPRGLHSKCSPPSPSGTTVTHALALQQKGFQGVAHIPLFHPPAAWPPNSCHQLTEYLAQCISCNDTWPPAIPADIVTFGHRAVAKMALLVSPLSQAFFKTPASFSILPSQDFTSGLGPSGHIRLSFCGFKE